MRILYYLGGKTAWAKARTAMWLPSKPLGKVWQCIQSLSLKSGCGNWKVRGIQIQISDHPYLKGNLFKIVSKNSGSKSSEKVLCELHAATELIIEQQSRTLRHSLSSEYQKPKTTPALRKAYATSIPKIMWWQYNELWGPSQLQTREQEWKATNENKRGMGKLMSQRGSDNSEDKWWQERFWREK